MSMRSETGNFSQTISESNDLTVSFYLNEPIICTAHSTLLGTFLTFFLKKLYRGDVPYTAQRLHTVEMLNGACSHWMPRWCLQSDIMTNSRLQARPRTGSAGW